MFITKHKKIVLFSVIIVLVGVLILSLSSFLVLKSYFTSEKLKPVVIEKLEKLLNRPVKIKTVHLSFRRGLCAIADKVEIEFPKDFSSDHPFMKIKELELNLKLFSLLKKEINFKAINLKEPEIIIESRIDGQTISDWLRKRSPLKINSDIILSKCEIKNGKIIYSYQGKRKIEFSNLNQNLVFKGTKKAQLSGETKVSFFTGKENFSRVDILVKNKITFGKTIKVNELELIYQPFTIFLKGTISEIRKTTQYNLRGQIQPISLENVFSSPLLNNFTKFLNKNPKGSISAKFNLLGNKNQISSFNLDGFIVDVPFSLSGKLKNYKSPKISLWSKSSFDLSTIKLLFNLPPEANFKGRTNLNLTLLTENKTLTRYGRFELTSGYLEHKSLPYPIKNLTAKINLQNKNIELSEISGIIGSSDFKIKGNLNSSFPVQGILKIESDYLNLDEILAKCFFLKQKKQGMRKPLNLTLEINSSLKKITFSNEEFKNFRLKGLYNKGKINLSEITFSGFDGEINGTSHFDLNFLKIPYKTDLRINKINTRKVLKKFLNFDQLFGQTDGQGYFEGYGLEKKYLKSTLFGQGEIKIQNGKFGQWPFLTKLISFLEVPQFEKISFKKLSTNFKIDRQKIYLQNLILETETSLWQASGYLDFNHNLDLEVAITLFPELVDQLRRSQKEIYYIPDSEGKVTINILINGNLQTPIFTEK
ncbi:MAG: AsmA family protein [Candidatus Aminicenantia bacterium]